MPQEPLRAVVDYLRDVSTAQELQTWADARLLELFVSEKEEAAFSALVRRHGPMVLGVCRRVLGDVHSADDAFQATFMVLIKRASSVDRHRPLGNWLYGVAQRVAFKAKAREAARHVRQCELRDVPGPETIDESTWQELRCVLDEQIGHLPSKYRAPIVLCYFQGKTHEQAAQELGWPRKSLSNRLASACDMLRRQLTSRGIALSASALATVLTERAAPAAVGGLLAISTTKAALSFAAGATVAGGVISAQSLALANGAMKGMFATKLKLTLAVLALGLVLSGVGVAGYRGLGLGDRAPDNKEPRPLGSGLVVVEQDKQKDNQPRLDLHSDPLPEGAMTRLGTVRWRVGPLTTTLAFTPNGETLAAIGDYHQFAGCLWLWDAKSGRLLHRVAVSTADESMAISPDGKLIFTGYTHTLIDVATGQVLRKLEGPANSAQGVAAFSPDGKTVAAGGFYRLEPAQLLVWDIEKPTDPRRFEGHSKTVCSVAFSPDGKFLASGGAEGSVRVWNVETGKEVSRIDLEKGEEIHFIEFLPDGKRLISLDNRRTISAAELTGRLQGKLTRNATIRLLDLTTGKPIREWKRDAEELASIAMSPDGKFLASGGRNGLVSIWDVETGKEIRRWLAHSYDVFALAYAPDGNVLVSSGQSDSTVRRWDPSTGKELKSDAIHTKKIERMRFSADAKTLTSCAEDGTIVEWEIPSGKAKTRLFAGQHGPAEPGWRINCLDLAPDGKTLAFTGSWRSPALKGDWNIRLNDTTTGKTLREIAGRIPVPGQVVFAGGINRIKFSPDGKLLASADRDLRLWDTATGAGSIYSIDGVQLRPFDFSPDGKLIALGGFVNTTKSYPIVLWSIADRKIIRRWNTPHSNVRDLLFSPDGRTLASVGGPLDKVQGGLDVKLWDMKSGKEVGSLAVLDASRWSKDDEVDSIAFSASSRLLAVGARHRLKDGGLEGTCTIHLFDLHTNHEIREIDAQQCSIWCLAFSPDARTLASGGGDSSILLWDLAAFTKADKGKDMSLTLEQASELWSELAGKAQQAENALWSLAMTPTQSLLFLKARMLASPAAPVEIASLISALDSKSFADRQQAADALEKLGDAAEAAVRKHLQGDITPEVRQRLDQFVKNRDKDLIRKLRAIEVLELIGNAEAGQVLELLAKAPNPRVSETASGALGRLKKRI